MRKIILILVALTLILFTTPAQTHAQTGCLWPEGTKGQLWLDYWPYGEHIPGVWLPDRPLSRVKTELVSNSSSLILVSWSNSFGTVQWNTPLNPDEVDTYTLYITYMGVRYKITEHVFCGTFRDYGIKSYLLMAGTTNYSPLNAWGRTTQ